MKNILTGLGVGLFFLFSSFLLLEGGLRLLGWTSEIHDPLYEQSDTLGLFHAPKSSRWERPSHGDSYAPVKLHINSNGLRDREYDSREKAPGVFRILLMGDSFIESRQVELPKTFGKQLEQLLNQEGKGKFEVVMAGVSGWSPLSEYMYLRNEGLKWNPDLVIVAFFLNDVTEDHGYRKYFKFDKEGLPISCHFPEDKSKHLKFSRALQLLQQVRRNHQMQREAPMQAVPQRTWPETGTLASNPYVMFNEKYAPEDERLWADTFRYLLGIKKLTRTSGWPPVIVYLPPGSQVASDEWVAGKTALGFAPDSLIRSTKPEQVLRNFARRNGMGFVDTLPALQAYKAQHPDLKLYTGFDAHFLEEGNSLIAKTVHDYLIKPQ
jgi:hypothetical protein